MAWTAPPTFVAGTTLTAANLNILGGDLTFLAGAQGNTVTTSETTASTTYTNLTTTGPTVTLTTGTHALVIVGSYSGNTVNNENYMSYAVSGATTIAASDGVAYSYSTGGSGGAMQASMISVQSALTAGSNTFTAKYRVTGGTGDFINRNILVIPLP